MATKNFEQRADHLRHTAAKRRIERQRAEEQWQDYHRGYDDDDDDYFTSTFRKESQHYRRNYEY